MTIKLNFREIIKESLKIDFNYFLVLNAIRPIAIKNFSAPNVRENYLIISTTRIKSLARSYEMKLQIILDAILQ